MVSSKILRTFQNVEGLFTKEERSKDRTLTLAEYLSLIDHAPKQERCKMILAMHTGMRSGEIKGLRWSRIDRQAGFIRLPAIYKPSEEDLQRAMERYTKWFDGKVAESVDQNVDQTV